MLSVIFPQYTWKTDAACQDPGSQSVFPMTLLQKSWMGCQRSQQSCSVNSEGQTKKDMGRNFYGTVMLTRKKHAEILNSNNSDLFHTA